MKKFLLTMLSLCVMVWTVIPAAHAEEAAQTYTVTANLYCPGELNTQLPGVTAYMTNPNNPLGIAPAGYSSVEAVAPTTPVSDNASITVEADGILVLTLQVPNPVFTLQKISGCSNAVIRDSVRDGETYSSMDGSLTRTGRITTLTIELSDRSGKYIFTDCTEFPTLLGVDWTVPLTLEVDLSEIPETPTGTKQPETEPLPAPSTPAEDTAAVVNFDALQAAIHTAETALQQTVVSADGSDVDPSKTWVTEEQRDALQEELAKAKAALSSTGQSTVDQQTQRLTDAYQNFINHAESGTLQSGPENLGKTLAPGTYTVSANLWFSKADTGLPLNPHLTNDTFPPYNPVPDNAQLTVAKDGTAQLSIPIVIQDKVMTLREVRGPVLLDSETTEDGAITYITVELGILSGDQTVVKDTWEADIEMGDLAMSISGLEKSHTWPMQFELNLSGVTTTDGGTMPTVELTLMNAEAASEAMAAASGTETDSESAHEETPTTEPESDTAADSTEGSRQNWILGAVLVIAVAAVAFVVKQKGGKKK